MTRPVRKTKITLVKVIPAGPKSFKVVSDPYPIHHANVRGYSDGTWRVSFPTELAAPSFLDSTLDRALVRAGDLVGRLAGRDLDRFTRAQAYAMAQQQCPRIVGHAVCGEPPEMGAVWCRWHPGGKVGDGTL